MDWRSIIFNKFFLVDESLGLEFLYAKFLGFEDFSLFLLFGDDERVGWNRFIYDSSFEDADNNYDVSTLTGLTSWRLLFLDGDFKVEMVLLARCCGIIFSIVFSILLWLDLAMMKD